MQSSLVNILFQSSTLAVLRVLNSGKRSLREIADLTEQSVGGVQGVLRRLSESGAIEGTREGQRVVYRLALTLRDRELLEILCQEYEGGRVAKRVERYSAKSEHVLKWIDETVEFYRER